MAPERTPNEWKRDCLDLLQAIDPSYKLVSGRSNRFIEFARKDSSGLWVSHNFLQTRGTYSLSFALLFTLNRSSDLLYYPLYAGGRFHRAPWRLLSEDFGVQRGHPEYPNGLWTEGPWRDNTMENLARGFAVSEETLYPRYIKGLREGKHNLVSLFECARSIVPRLSSDPKATIVDHAHQLGIDPELVSRFPLGCAKIDALAIARSEPIYQGWGASSDVVDLRVAPPEVIILQCAKAFIPEVDRLDELVRTASSL